MNRGVSAYVSSDLRVL